MEVKIRIADNFELDVRSHLIERGVAILGLRGSGKSYTASVICEQLLEAGQPVVIIDLIGEHFTLRERFPVLIAASGDAPYADVKGLTANSAPRLAEFIVEHGLSLILDLSHGLMVDRLRILGEFLEAFYRAEEKHRHPYVVILDEAHRVLPEKGVVRLKEIKKAQEKVEHYVYELSATGRHMAVGPVVVARRSAEISKLILSQCEVRILHKLVDPTDLKYASNWLTREEVERLRNLNKGEAVVVGLGEPIWIRVRRRLCSHGGETPLTKPVVTPDLSEAVERLTELLKAEKVPEAPPETPPSALVEELERLRRRSQELEQRLRVLESELSEAQAQVKSLEALAEERLRRIKELEARLPEAETWEEMRSDYERRLAELEEKLRETEEEKEELHRQLLEVSEDLEKLEEVKSLLMDWRDVIVELGQKLDVELIPSDIQAIVDERDHYRQLYEELKQETERRRRLTEDVLADPAVQDWVKTAKTTLKWFMDRRSEHWRILRKVVVTDPSYLFLPEEFPEVSVSPSTVASYLNDFALKGFVLKHEKAKMGRTAYSNALPLWVSQNVRRIRLDAPDEAIKAIVEELKSYVLKWR